VNKFIMFLAVGLAFTGCATNPKPARHQTQNPDKDFRTVVAASLNQQLHVGMTEDEVQKVIRSFPPPTITEQHDASGNAELWYYDIAKLALTLRDEKLSSWVISR
jgi:outer membrane protein assembly factor BamE (lipoprotein component of BamABCDE complex)